MKKPNLSKLTRGSLLVEIARLKAAYAALQPKQIPFTCAKCGTKGLAKPAKLRTP